MDELKPIIADIQAKLHCQIDTIAPISVASSCRAYSLTTNSSNASKKQHRYFLKTEIHPAENRFFSEGYCLELLAATELFRVPRVIASSNEYLLIDFISSGKETDAYWERLGRNLATMHSQKQMLFNQAVKPACFGFPINTFCGAAVQNNSLYKDGYQFYREQRLDHQLQLAIQKNLLSKKDIKQLHDIGTRLEELIPEQPPCLLHGDLWNGNVFPDAKGHPVLIDPASYWGWHEAEIAMTKLFGGFSERFYDAYQEVLPLFPGWEDRVGIYNLYHLLNHLNLFGEHYLDTIRQTLKKFARQTPALSL